jgi:hypothetical protein
MNGVSLNIEHLVVDGVAGNAPRDGQRIGRMTETALRQLFVTRGVPRGFVGGKLCDLVAPRLNVHAGASDRELARELALSLYRMCERME